MARRIIESMTKNPKPGEIFEGKIVRFLQFGAFVELVPGKDALVHVSQLSDPPPARPDQDLKMGDTIRVRVTEIDGQGRINATARGLDEPFDAENPEPGRPPRGTGRPGGDRGGDRNGGGRDRDRDRDRGRGPRGGGRDRDPDRMPSSPAPAAVAAPEGSDEDDLPKARFRPRR
jgi:polyribonucleotide nucleotidyltransferase